MTAPVPGMQLVDEFEKAFQNCFAILTNPDDSTRLDSETIKSTTDTAIQHFYDVSQRMEIFFLQRKLLAGVQKPEHFLAESIQELTTELGRKEALLDRYHAKLDTWKKMLKEVSDDTSPPGYPMESGSSTADHTSSGTGAGPFTQMPMQTAKGSIHPVHMMLDLNMPSSSSAASMHAPVDMQPPPMHQYQFMGGPQPIGLQGPLGYTSNYSVPEGSG